MAQRNEITAVYVAAVIQGLALVTFPAASTVFTSPTVLRPVEHGIRRHVSASGHHGDIGIAAGRGTDPPPGHQAHLSAGPHRQLGVDGFALLEPVCHVQRPGRLWHAASGDDEPGHRLRSDRAGPEHLHGGLLPAEDRLGRADPQRAVRVGDGAGSGVCRDFHRSGHLVGAAGSGGVLLLALLLFSLRLPLQAGTDKTRTKPAGQDGAAGAFLDLCRVCLALRHLRDDERQLGDSLHDARVWERRTTARLVGPDGLLGDGDRRAGVVCRHRETVSRATAPTGSCPSWSRSPSSSSRLCPRAAWVSASWPLAWQGWAVRRCCR